MRFMKKLSYLFILAGLFLLFVPKLIQYYEDQDQQHLLEQFEQGQADSTSVQMENPLRTGIERLNQLFEDNEEDQDDLLADDNHESLDVNSPLGDEAIGLIIIPKINVKLPILEGATKQNMKHAAAHLSETAPLGSRGNAAIAAHRAHTKGRLFNRLNEVEKGDSIEIVLKEQRLKYKVYSISIVEPTDVSVLEGNHKDEEITLITCDPLINPTHRLIVKARAVGLSDPS